MLMTKNSGVSLDSKAVSDAGIIEGYASVFGVVDSYGEVVEPGAFTKSLEQSAREGRRIKMLYQHDPHQPIGIWESLKEDGRGLLVKGRLLVEESPKAREVHGLLKAGALDGLSIGYRTIASEPKKGMQGVLSLRELDLMENSIVTFAANERAKVEVVKSILDGGRMPTVRQFEGLLRDAGFSKAKAAGIASLASPELMRDAGEDDEADAMARFWEVIRNAPIIDETGEPD